MTALAGAHAIVTGGSSGIGLATARLLAAPGARVSLVARDAARLGRRRRARSSAPVGAIAPRRRGATPTRVRRRDRVGWSTVNGPCDMLVTSAGSRTPATSSSSTSGVPRPDGRRLLRHAAHGARRRAVDDRAAARAPRARRRRPPGSSACSATPRTRRRSTRCAGSPRRCGPSSRPTASSSRARTRPTPTRRARRARTSSSRRRRRASRPRSSRATPTRWRRRSCAGIERDRLVITADVQTAALARAAGLLGPVRALHDGPHGAEGRASGVADARYVRDHGHERRHAAPAPRPTAWARSRCPPTATGARRPSGRCTTSPSATTGCPTPVIRGMAILKKAAALVNQRARQAARREGRR